MSLKRRHLDTELEENQETAASSSTRIRLAEPVSDPSSHGEEEKKEEEQMEVDSSFSDEEGSDDCFAEEPVKEWFDLEDSDSEEELTIIEAPLHKWFFPPRIVGSVITQMDYRRLLRKALEDTFDMYKRLKKERKPLPEDMDSDPRRYIKRQLKYTCLEHLPSHVQECMEYTFDLICAESPFKGLRLIRSAENGERLYPLIQTEPDGRIPEHEWSLSKSQQYMQLVEKTRELFESSARLEDMSLISERLLELAKVMGLHFLSRLDVDICMQEAWLMRHVVEAVQEWKFYCFLSQNETKICYEQKLWDQFWDKIQVDFPLIDRNRTEHIIKSLHSSDGESLSQKLKLARDEARMAYERTKERWNKTDFSPGQYYKLKYKKALELGIIMLNEKGFYEEIFDVSAWKIS